MPESENMYVDAARVLLRFEHQLRRLPAEERAKLESNKPPNFDDRMRAMVRTVTIMSDLLDEVIELTSAAGQGDQR